MTALRWTILLTILTASSVAMADAFECKATETQAECHARLHCKAYEELEDCQKRLRAAAQNNNSSGGDSNRNDDRGNSRDDGRNDDRGRDRDDDRGRDRDDDRRSSSRERGDREGRSSGRRRGRHGGSRRFEANKTFGLGLELGEPTGINGKVFVSPSGAIDFGVGAIYDHYYYGDGIHLYGDYLWHPVSLASGPALELPFYVGVGLRYWDFNYCYQGLCDYGGSAIGVRVPLGLSFDFNNVPLDIFVQVVPVLDFVRGDYYDRYRDRNHLAIDGSVGVRFWFK